MSQRATAAGQLVERLIDWGIEVCFGRPGDGINGVMQSLRTHQDQIRFHVRQEKAAALAGCAYSKFTGRPPRRDAMREASPHTLLITDGCSCRSQIEHGSHRRALHLAQVVQMAMQHGPTEPSPATFAAR